MRTSTCPGVVAGLLLAFAVPGTVLPAGAQSAGASGQHSVVVTPDGAVWAWGGNGYGQLGDGTTTAKKVPAQVPGLTGIVAVAAGGSHTLALGADGFVWAWGSNNDGQLGDGTTTQRTGPVSVPLASIVAVAAGDGHSVALAEDGTVWVWGRNSNGQLGDGTTTRRLSPQMVLGITASALTAGYAHTAVVASDGRAWAWGANGYWQLGDGTQTQRTTPVQMAGVTAAVAVAAGQYHTLVLRTTGSVLACGMNTYGQLGDGTSTSRATPGTGFRAVWCSRHSGQSLPVGCDPHGWHGPDVGLQRVRRPGGWDHDVALDASRACRLVRYRRPRVRPNPCSRNRGRRDGLHLGVELCTGQLGDGTNVSRYLPAAISEAGFDWLVATPAFSIAAGTYYTAQTVVVTALTAGAEIHFTLSGDDPTALDPIVASGGSVVVDHAATLKARAFKAGRPPSRIAAATYTLTASAPTFNPGGGTYSTPRTVSMSATTPASTVRYTGDGTQPTESSAVYSVPLAISMSTVIRGRRRSEPAGPRARSRRRLIR